MAFTGQREAGAREVVMRLDPRTALDIFFALCASQHAEETTRQQRISVVGVLPQLQRALVTTGIVSDKTLHDFRRHLLLKPAPPPLDDAIKALKGDR